MPNLKTDPSKPAKGSATPPGPDPKAARERESASISEQRPGDFKNDPDDPTNPNEAIERSREELRRRAQNADKSK